MNERKIVGLTPWLPWPLTRWPWWTEPVRAERLAALRIGFAAVLLLDILCTYFPLAKDFFGPGSLGSPEVFAPTSSAWYRWSLLRGIEDPRLYAGALVLWAVAAVFLLAGVVPRVSAAIAWALSISIMNVNCYLHNSGDNVRTITLFYLMLCPCAAAWSLKSFAGRRIGKKEPVYVPAWPVRLLFVQLTLIYFLNGVYKLAGSEWRDGHIMYSVLANLAWTRFSFAQLSLPAWALQAMTWTPLVFELGFPLLVMIPRVRVLALCVGILFHLGTGIFLQLGPFPLYMMCLYLPLVPWEKLVADPLHRQPMPEERLQRMMCSAYPE
jgi:hypothetical protein